MNEHKNIITIEDEIKEFSDKPVKSSAIFKALQGGGMPKDYPYVAETFFDGSVEFVNSSGSLGNMIIPGDALLHATIDGNTIDLSWSPDHSCWCDENDRLKIGNGYGGEPAWIWADGIPDGPYSVNIKSESIDENFKNAVKDANGNYPYVHEECFNGVITLDESGVGSFGKLDLPPHDLVLQHPEGTATLLYHSNTNNWSDRFGWIAILSEDDGTKTLNINGYSGPTLIKLTYDGVDGNFVEGVNEVVGAPVQVYTTEHSGNVVYILDRTGSRVTNNKLDTRCPINDNGIYYVYFERGASAYTHIYASVNSTRVQIRSFSSQGQYSDLRSFSFEVRYLPPLVNPTNDKGKVLFINASGQVAWGKEALAKYVHNIRYVDGSSGRHCDLMFTIINSVSTAYTTNEEVVAALKDYVGADKAVPVSGYYQPQPNQEGARYAYAISANSDSTSNFRLETRTFGTGLGMGYSNISLSSTAGSDSLTDTVAAI